MWYTRKVNILDLLKLLIFFQEASSPLELKKEEDANMQRVSMAPKEEVTESIILSSMLITPTPVLSTVFITTRLVEDTMNVDFIRMKLTLKNELVDVYK